MCNSPESKRQPGERIDDLGARYSGGMPGDFELAPGRESMTDKAID
jgi:hypothetical protein